jgi:hypothetical protein
MREGCVDRRQPLVDSAIGGEIGQRHRRFASKLSVGFN